MSIKSSVQIDFSFDYRDAVRNSRSKIRDVSDSGIEHIWERYKKFLILAIHHPTQPLAPSIDIDEMWHLHMLNPRKYFADCIANFGYIIDHIGSFGFRSENRETWLRIYEDTQRAWHEYFGESMCPDPIHKDVTPFFEASTSHGHGYKPEELRDA